MNIANSKDPLRTDIFFIFIGNWAVMQFDTAIQNRLELGLTL